MVGGAPSYRCEPTFPPFQVWLLFFAAKFRKLWLVDLASVLRQDGIFTLLLLAVAHGLKLFYPGLFESWQFDVASLRGPLRFGHERVFENFPR